MVRDYNFCYFITVCHCGTFDLKKSACSIQVVHPAPGNPNGTLVNAVLHHCKVSTFTWLTNSTSLSDGTADSSDEDIDVFHVDQLPSGGIGSQVSQAVVRPGIVHRLDKGTSGLLVVAKVSSV